MEVCKVIPSCFEAETNDSPVSVFANGSTFLFFIISEKVVKSPFYNAADFLITADVSGNSIETVSPKASIGATDFILDTTPPELQ